MTSSVVQHYASHLAPIYVWMTGGVESALKTGEEDVVSLIPGRGQAVDLGAGFGMHSVALARAGYEVIAIDQSQPLLQTLAEAGAGLMIRTVEADLLHFRDVLKARVELIVCMGDTLTHLESFEQVEQLARDISASLLPGGRFVATFRDYTDPASGDARFIPVRSDADRILTCFLESLPGHIIVHDVLHERSGSVWTLKVSSYPKLRLAPAEVQRVLTKAGLATSVEAGPRGMVRINSFA